MNINIDIAIIALFLFFNLIAGFGYGKEVKTIKDYALGGRKFSIGALVATIVATWASGTSFFVILSKTYSEGFVYMLAYVGQALSFVMIAMFFIPRMGEFLGKVSIAEALGELYGKPTRIITAIAGTIGAAGLVAVEFKVFGNIFAYFLGLSPFISVIIAGAITTFYSSFGGIRAVTLTDILQFFTFGVIIPMVGFIVWSQFYDRGFSIEQAFLDPKFNIMNIINPGNPEFVQTLIMLLYFAIPTFSAPAFQRIAMGNNIAQVKKAFLIAGLFLIVIQSLIAWIPFLLNSMYPDIPADNLLGFVIDHYSFTGLKGLIIVAIIAFAMSTADSRINSATVLFTNDICKVVSKKPLREIFISRIFAIVVGVFSIWLSLFESDILGIVIFTNSFYYPIVTPPFLLTVLGFRSSGKSVLAGIAAGFITTALWKAGIIVKPFFALLPEGMAKLSADMVGVMLAMLMNTLFLFIFHYAFRQNGGFVGIKDRSYIEHEKFKRNKYFNKLTQDCKKFSVNRFLNKISPKRSITYTMMGMYFILCTFATMFSTQIELVNTNGKALLILYQSMMITGVVIAMYPIWPLSIKESTKEKAIKYMWPVAAFFVLIFCSTFFVIVSKFSILQTALFIINLMIAAIMFGWRLSLIAIPFGCYATVHFYKYSYGNQINSYKFESPEFVLLYVVLLIGSTLLIFLKPKQDYIEETENKVDDLTEVVTHYSEKVINQQTEIERLGCTAQKILNNVNHELRLPVGNVKNFAEMLSEGLEKYSKEQLKELSDEVVKNSTRLSSMILNMLDLATLDAKKIELNKHIVNLSELIEDRVKTCCKVYLEGKEIDFDITIEGNILVNVDANYIRQTIDNIIINAINYSKDGLIKVSVLKKPDNKVEVVVKDEGIGIPQNEIYDVFTPFKMSSKTESMAEGRGVGLALCKSAVEAHGGTITVESDGVKGATFKIVLDMN